MVSFFCNMKLKVLILFLSAVLICGCRSSRETVSMTTALVTDTGMTEAGPRMLVILGSISYDSITGNYDLTLDRHNITPGRPLKKAEQIQADQAVGLNYMLLTKENKTISIHHIDNPLIREVEYNDGDKLGRRTIQLQKTDILWQIAIEPETETVLFRNGKKDIGSLNIEME